MFSVQFNGKTYKLKDDWETHKILAKAGIKIEFEKGTIDKTDIALAFSIGTGLDVNDVYSIVREMEIEDYSNLHLAMLSYCFKATMTEKERAIFDKNLAESKNKRNSDLGVESEKKTVKSQRQRKT